MGAGRRAIIFRVILFCIVLGFEPFEYSKIIQCFKNTENYAFVPRAITIPFITSDPQHNKNITIYSLSCQKIFKMLTLPTLHLTTYISEHGWRIPYDTRASHLRKYLEKLEVLDV